MATASRNPLSSRLHSIQKSNPFSQSKIKRPRSPEPVADNVVQKRSRLAVVAPAAGPASRDKKKETKQERAARDAVWKDKYTRHFPEFSFYFDKDNIAADTDLHFLVKRIKHLKGTIEPFFSKNVTHLISDQPIPKEPDDLEAGDKENKSINRSKKTRGELIAKAQQFDMKIWNSPKLLTVLERLVPATIPATNNAAASLNRMLESERIHGTSERDPTQKRHDFHYFTKGSFFVVVEDMKDELATIVAQEYDNPKDGAKPSWPVLHLDPRARGPFVEFDDKERRRYERAQRCLQDGERQEEKRRKLRMEEAARRKAEAESRTRRAGGGDLRRTVSLTNLHRQAALEVDADLDLDAGESANASGFLASGPGGYFAASGNSVGITSGTGTTSTTGHAFKVPHIPTSLRDRKEVVTARRLPSTTAKNKGQVMGPPSAIPDRQSLLKRSRSTNTMRLPKRDEASKPGYCESCRQKFESFKDHIEGKRHRKFATNDAHFSQLDCLLDSVQRRTLEDVQYEDTRRDFEEDEDMDY
ncbi:Dfp1/Him1, central region-domain-containing protein [Mycena floridula]|nr:Dfp1/Him1, central region-domain-containing protein [Mycena floridula]